jgi:hypothetical protein
MATTSEPDKRVGRTSATKDTPAQTSIFSEMRTATFESPGGAFLGTRDNIPPDPHCNMSRYRLHALFALFPSTNGLKSTPPVWDSVRNRFVSQSARLNSGHASRPRGCASLTEAQATNLFLGSTILQCSRGLPCAEPR